MDKLKVLDVGCGTGSYLKWVKERVGECYGLEFNEGMLAQAKAKFDENSGVTLRLGSVLDMSCYANETFEVVIMT